MSYATGVLIPLTLTATLTMKDKTEELRLDIYHNAPLPNDQHKVITFEDCTELVFQDPFGEHYVVNDYEIDDDNRLVVTVDWKV